MENRENILSKIEKLVREGENLNQLACKNIYDDNYNQRFPEHFEISQQDGLFLWRDAADFLVENSVPSGSLLLSRLKEIRKTNDAKYDALYRNFQERLAFVKLFKSVIENNELDSWRYAVSAQDFSEFLDHAKDYHKRGNKELAGVIASAVLEDTIKKVATKYGIELLQDGKYKKSELLIDELVKANAFNSTKAKIIKSSGALRNKASHANWDEFDIKDVGIMIQNVEQFIADYLYPTP